MSRLAIALGYIEFDMITQEDLDYVVTEMEGARDDPFTYVEGDKDMIDFKMAGRNYVNWTPLITIRDTLLQMDLKFIIIANEYLATDEGYVFEAGKDT